MVVLDNRYWWSFDSTSVPVGTREPESSLVEHCPTDRWIRSLALHPSQRLRGRAVNCVRAALHRAAPLGFPWFARQRRVNNTALVVGVPHRQGDLFSRHTRVQLGREFLEALDLVSTNCHDGVPVFHDAIVKNRQGSDSGLRSRGIWCHCCHPVPGLRERNCGSSSSSSSSSSSTDGSRGVRRRPWAGVFAAGRSDRLADNRNTQPALVVGPGAVLDAIPAEDFLDRGPDLVRGDGKANPGRAPAGGNDGGVDPDDFSPQVEEGAARVSGVDRVVRLDDVPDRRVGGRSRGSGAEFPVDGGDDPRGHGALQAKWIADGHDRLPNQQVGGRTEADVVYRCGLRVASVPAFLLVRGRRLVVRDFQDGEIDVRVDTDDAAPSEPVRRACSGVDHGKGIDTERAPKLLPDEGLGDVEKVAGQKPTGEVARDLVEGVFRQFRVFSDGIGLFDDVEIGADVTGSNDESASRSQIGPPGRFVVDAVERGRRIVRGRPPLSSSLSPSLLPLVPSTRNVAVAVAGCRGKNRFHESDGGATPPDDTGDRSFGGRQILFEFVDGNLKRKQWGLLSARCGRLGSSGNGGSKARPTPTPKGLDRIAPKSHQQNCRQRQTEPDID